MLAGSVLFPPGILPFCATALDRFTLENESFRNDYPVELGHTHAHLYVIHR
jgi:hypothetical protein